MSATAYPQGYDGVMRREVMRGKGAGRGGDKQMSGI